MLFGQWRFFVALLAVSFGLNWVWEMFQMPAYAEMADRSWTETAWRCTLATLGDVAVTFAVYGVGALAARRLEWGAMRRWNVFVAAGLMGAAVAIALEWRALAIGTWSYNRHMPVLAFLDVGLWPLLQLTVLVPLALAIASFWRSSQSTES